MSIEGTYGKLLIEEYIKKQLKNGETLSAMDLFSEADALNTGKDLTAPQIALTSEHKVIDGEEASAIKINNTFEVIEQDLTVAFKELSSLSQNALDTYERWKIESEKIEKELINIEEEVENLLLLTQDTEGYHSVIVDNFTDLKSLDLSSTTTNVDVETSSVSLKHNSDLTTRLFIENTLEESDITFRVRSNIISRSDLSGSNLVNIFSDETDVWHTLITTDVIKPVVCELIVKLDEEVKFNRIRISFHDGGHSSSMNVTALYSTDDVIYTRVPCDNYSQNLTRSGNFYFNEISAKYVKLILSKEAPDRSKAGVFNYQFGFRNIGFYSESFDPASIQKFESNWLFVEKENKDIFEFEKATLETCEEIPEDTLINYSIAATNDNTSTTPDWYKITPTNRNDSGSFNPELTIFEVGETLNQEITDIFRYTASNASYKYIDVDGVMQDGGSLISEDQLYSYLNDENDVILNSLLYNESSSEKNKVNFNEKSLVLFRGVNDWEVTDSHYQCVIEILNKVEINTRDALIDIDDIPSGPGDITVEKGIHKVRVKKEDFSSLKSIIENAVDFFAAIQMEKVGIFDMLSNVKNTNFNKYGLDLSLPGKNSSVNTTVKTVFLIKKVLPTYNTVTSATTEKFKIKFNLINQLMTYVKVKGELETNSSSITPSCDAYQVKLG